MLNKSKTSIVSEYIEKSRESNAFLDAFIVISNSGIITGKPSTGVSPAALFPLAAIAEISVKAFENAPDASKVTKIKDGQSASGAPRKRIYTGRVRRHIKMIIK
jgi:hypothetical protein